MNKTNIEHPTSNAERRTWGDAALRMTNDEFPMRKAKPANWAERFGHSCFVIRISSLSRAKDRMRKAECGIKQLTTDH